MKKALFVAASLLFLSFSVSAKKLNIIDIEKGQIFDDNTEQVNVSLSEDNVGGGGAYSLKLEYPADGGWAGFFMPKKSAWSEYKTLKCFLFNPEKKNIKLSFVIKDKNHIPGESGRGKGGWAERKTWCIVPLDLKPGMNEISFDIAGLKTQEGKLVDFSKIIHWGFYYRFFPELDWEMKESVPFSAFLSKLKLESGE